MSEIHPNLAAPTPKPRAAMGVRACGGWMSFWTLLGGGMAEDAGQRI